MTQAEYDELFNAGKKVIGNAAEALPGGMKNIIPNIQKSTCELFSRENVVEYYKDQLIPGYRSEKIIKAIGNAVTQYKAASQLSNEELAGEVGTAIGTYGPTLVTVAAATEVTVALGKVALRGVVSEVTVGEVAAIEGTSETVSLYRAMSEAEYKSLMDAGKFTPYDRAMETKWFATTSEDAVEWGKLFYPDGNYRVVEIEVPTSSLDDMYFVNKLDNIGPAYNAELDVINNVIKTLKEILK